MNARLQHYDRVRAVIDERGFDPASQTKIALFVGAARSINASIMAALELQPQITVVYPFVHGQYFRELEFVSLLARVTHWSPDLALYAHGSALAAPLWSEWWRLQVAAVAADPAAAFRALALGHALLAQVRLSPVIPERVDELDPFVVSLRRIEQESGRMIQAQIRLLKDGANPLSAKEREHAIEAERACVDGVFTRFLGWLSQTEAAQPSGV